MREEMPTAPTTPQRTTQTLPTTPTTPTTRPTPPVVVGVIRARKRPPAAAAAPAPSAEELTTAAEESGGPTANEVQEVEAQAKDAGAIRTEAGDEAEEQEEEGEEGGVALKGARAAADAGGVRAGADAQVMKVMEDEPDAEEAQQMIEAPYRGLLRQRVPRVMVAVISGGKKPTTKANRDAVVQTWFDNDTYIATHETVDTKRVLWLPDIAEAGGFRELPRKVKHMWAHIYENYIDKYDWFVKADDDTYVNLPRLRKTLSVYNPDIPVYLGKPFASKVRGAAGPGALWRDFTTMAFCHGGSGYVLSRELLRLVGKTIRDAPVVTSLEDCAVSSVLYERTGVRCINVNAKMFGGLDLLANSHDQKQIISTVSNFEKRNPEIIWKTATIHSVTADTTFQLHDIYKRLATKDLEDKVDELAEKDLEVRRWMMSSSWNCSVPVPLKDQVPHSALCMQSALLSPPPFPPKHFTEIETLWQIALPGQSCSLRDGFGLAEEQSKAPQPDQIFAWASYTPDFVGEGPDHYAPRAIFSSDPMAQPMKPRSFVDVILVAMDASSSEDVVALRLLLRSLRATGSLADVVVFTPSDAGLAAQIAGFCGVTVATYDATALRSALALISGVTPNQELLSFALFENFLHGHAHMYRYAMHVKVDSFFQRDPFVSLSTNGGTVMLYVENPVVTFEQVPCFSGHLRLHELLSRLSLSVALGPAGSLRDYFSRAVTVPWRHRRCRFGESVMLQAFRKDFSMYFKVTVVTPWDGPMALLTEREEPYLRNGTGDNAGRLIFLNGRGVAATAVFNYQRLLSASALETKAPAALHLKPASQRKTLSDLVLAELPRRLHGTFKRATAVQPLTQEQWPPDSKAYLRWFALSTKVNIDSLAFRPVWEMLARYKYYNSNDSAAAARRVAHVSTHKTGADLLSGILLRYAGRYGLRVFHRGEWPFLPPELLSAPEEGWRRGYDVVFSQLNPKGQWSRGDFKIADKFYNHILGSDHRRLLMLQDPHQHYVSWLFYYVIPKKTRFKPVDVVSDYVKHRMNKNMLCQEFNLRTLEDVTEFVRRELPRFDVVLLKERLDESLVLMKRRFKWNLQDIIYLYHPVVNRRFDGRALPPTPNSKEMTKDITVGIENVIRMDRIFYDAANKRLDELIALEGSDFKAEVEAFQQVNAAVAEVCKQYNLHPFCRWLWTPEMELFSLIGPAGYSQGLPMF